MLMIFVFKKINILKGLSCCLLLTLLLVCRTSYAGHDKALHYGLSAITGYIAETTLHKKFDSDTKRIIYGTALGTLPGLIKEIIDANDTSNNGSGFFNGDDLLADIAGAFTGALIANKVNKNLLATIQKKGDAYGVALRYQY